MRAIFSSFILAAAGAIALPAVAEDADVLKAGKRVYMTKTCLACHGRGGAKPVLSYPALAGQNEGYLLEQLHLIAAGERNGSVDPDTGHPFIKGMADIMHLVTEDDMKNVAAWLTAQPSAKPEALDPAPSEEELAAGAKAYKRLGCRSCHGKEGEKAQKNTYPLIAGLDRDYLIRQMTDMREKLRTGGQVKLMYGVIKRAKDEDIAAMATWLSQIDRTAE